MKRILTILILLALGFLAWRAIASNDTEADGPRTVEVSRGSIHVEAVAVGKVEARFEVPVTATSGGVITRRFVQLGQAVKKGDPLFEVRPVLTDAQRLNAQRSLLQAREGAEGAEEMAGGRTVAGLAMRVFQGGNSMDRMKAGAERARKDAEHQLELLLEGQTEIDGHVIDYLVRAPIDGHVISEDLEVGEPVVPASTFGAGTVLVTLADLDHPVFRGTVDEIDVGRLAEGMTGSLTLGARPGLALEAELTEISLRAESRNNAVVFPVEMDVAPPEDLVLRSGYSAVAAIRIAEANDVLLIPERLVRFEGERASVQRLRADGETEEVEIETGLSDSLRIEVRSGLAEGDTLLERGS